MADDKTPHYKWPLPSAENLLSEDVGRIRDSLSGIDTELHTEAKASADAIEAESKARADAIAAESKARGEDKSALEAKMKKIRTLALAGL
ncbi:hypothetical protein [Cardiobacterium hominis]|jgi:hypothetical protein|uniref:hypothetical protein n=1 Tax=Cardiobacterium hominis TaxID=2718 RepID=UPI0028E7B4B2|nr:hypothetical protein [Cardiobacterium hominis]